MLVGCSIDMLWYEFIASFFLYVSVAFLIFYCMLQPLVISGCAEIILITLDSYNIWVFWVLGNESVGFVGVIA